jgi:proliferating cell nuclear antigen
LDGARRPAETSHQSVSVFFAFLLHLYKTHRYHQLYTMFEARLSKGIIWKQIFEAIKDLVNEANCDVSEEELSIQCMDSSHVSLVDVCLTAAAFDLYRVDKPLALGVSCGNLYKVLKMMNKDDSLLMKAEDEGDTLTLMYESDDANKSIADFGT